MSGLCKEPSLERASTRLVALIGAGNSKTFPAGAELASPEQDYFYCFLIGRGWSMRCRALDDGRRQVLDVTLPGELAFIDACIFKKTSHTLIALTEVQATLYAADKVLALARGNTEVLSLITWIMASEQAISAEHVVNLGQRTAYERVIHLLLELWHRLSALGLAKGREFELPLTQEVMADMLGLSIIHINRTLQRLRKDRMFEITSSRPVFVKVLHPEAAKRICNFDESYLRAPAVDLH